MILHEPPSVCVFHPGTQHSYFTARAFQDAGMLEWYATQIYYDPSRLPYSLLQLLPISIRNPLEREFKRRHHPLLNPKLVRTGGMWEWAHVMATRAGLAMLGRRLYQIGSERFGRAVGRMALRSQPDLLWGFDKASLEAFSAARRAHIRCILDYTTSSAGHRRQIIEDEIELSPRGWKPIVIPTNKEIDRDEKEMELATSIVVGSHIAFSSLPPVYQYKAVVCPYGMASSRFSPHRSRRHGDFIVLYVGVISPLKGIRYLLEACSMLYRKLGLRLRLRLVGKLIVPRGIIERYADFVEHIPHVPYSAVHKLYENADILVQPSLIEGLSRVVLEAASAALPIIATPNTVVETVFQHGESCLLVPIRNPRAIADSIELLYLDEELCEQLGHNARHQALKYTWDRYAKQIVQIAKDVCSEIPFP